MRDLPLSQPHRDVLNGPVRRETRDAEPTRLPVVLRSVPDTDGVGDPRHFARLDEFRVGTQAANECHARDLRRAGGGECAGEGRRGSGAEGATGGG